MTPKEKVEELYNIFNKELSDYKIKIKSDLKMLLPQFQLDCDHSFIGYQGNSVADFRYVCENCLLSKSPYSKDWNEKYAHFPSRFAEYNEEVVDKNIYKAKNNLGLS